MNKRTIDLLLLKRMNLGTLSPRAKAHRVQARYLLKSNLESIAARTRIVIGLFFLVVFKVFNFNLVVKRRHIVEDIALPPLDEEWNHQRNEERQ